MEKSFNKLSETSAGFIMAVNEDVWMDVKQILLQSDGTKKMFKGHYILYLMIINMNKTNRIECSKEFVEFMMGETKISRAYFFKYVSIMIDNKLLERLDVRGWYKIKHINKHKKQAIQATITSQTIKVSRGI